MPELPEVEVIRRSLAPHLEGRRFTGVVVRQVALRLPADAVALERGLRGRRILALVRRAKYLLVRIEGQRLLVIHLGMSGRLTLVRRSRPLERHDHLVFRLGRPPGRDRGPRGASLDLRFHDPRRFGLVMLIPAEGWERHALFRHLGPEPLDPELTADHLLAAARGRRVAIKSLIMDAGVLVGVGNIYASEALHRAGVDPRLPAGRLGRRRWSRLLAAIRTVLERSIEDGGTSLSDFLDGEGRPGLHRTHLAVYGRQGEPCLACGRRVRRIVQTGRSTYYCGRCQR
jgi:formamidopyrimidine-DNA glycosylase